MRKTSFRRLGWLTLALFCSMAIIAGLVVRHQLPPIYSLADYKPIQAAHVFADDGQTIGTYALERRTAVPFAVLPSHLVHAFLAAEDASFYEHEGIDWFGVGRALLKNLRPGAHLQGASTITQQTVKTLVLGPERSLWRKVREAILARRLEQMLPKDEILTLYLNQIYFGSGAHGVEQAAQTYFAVHVRDVTLAQAALLAAIPKNPSRYTLRGDLTATRARQTYVLQQMVAHNWATPEAAQAALAEPLPAMPQEPEIVAASLAYVETVRRELAGRFGDEALNTGGWRIYTHLNVADQLAATRAVSQTLGEVARRHGYAGAPGRLEADTYEEARRRLRVALGTRIAAAGPVPAGATGWGWNLVGLGDIMQARPKSLAQRLDLVPLQPYQQMRALVVAVPGGDGPAVMDLGGQEGLLPLRNLTWARPYNPANYSPAPKRVSDVLRVGDLITVEVQPAAKQGQASLKDGLEVALVPDPKVEGALVALAPPHATVRALVGSRDPLAGAGFNRATQAKRQPGSAFKPILYAAGLAAGTITPASLCSDSPVVIPDPITGKLWKPENYEDGRYDGNIVYRTALARSKNTCSVRLLQKVGLPATQAMAQALGIDTPLPNNLTLALGTGEVTPLQMATAMHTLASGGVRAEPTFVRRVLDGNGEALELAPVPEPVQAISPAAAFVLTSMMRSVVEGGTARRAQVLGRPVAAKTGTSQLSRDAWLVGFVPSLASAVWVGLDDDTSMGRETGGSAALPAWLRFMGASLAGVPAAEFAMPSGVTTARIDPSTGGASDGEDSVVEVFVAGTEPLPQAHEPQSIFLEDD